MKRLIVILWILLSACTVEPVPVPVTRGVGTAVPTPTALPATFQTATPTPMPDLAGTAWELALINSRTPIPDSRITLVFAKGRAGGFAGCNEYGGVFTSAFDGSFAIPEIAKNEQDCQSPEGVMEQETAYVQALAQAVRYYWNGDQLALLTAVGETVLTFTRQPPFAANPADLIGVAWQLADWHGRDLLPDTQITLVFDGSGTISGYAGCRHYLGSYQAENDDIRFPMLSMVEESCALGEEYLIQEGDFTTALSQATQYRIENGQLELFTNPGEQLLFVPIGSETGPSSGEMPEQPAASPIQLDVPRMLGRGQIVDAAFTPDGTGVAVAWANGVSFTAVAGAAEQWFQPLPANPVAIDVRPDGQAVAVALADGNVVELAVADGRAQTYPVVHATSRLGDVAYAPDGHRIAVQLTGTNRFDPIFVLDLADGRVYEIPETGGGGDTNPYLVWSPDGTAVTLASDRRGCGHIVDVQTGERLFTLQGPDGCYSSYAVVWSPDGRTLTLNSPNYSIDTIDFASQTVIQSIPSSALFFQPSITAHPLFASPDGRWLASKGGYGFSGGSYPLQVWEAATGTPVGQPQNTVPTHRLVSSFAGNTIISLYADGTLTRWAFDAGAAEETVGRLPVYAVRYPYFWSPDGRKIATPTDYQFVIWDVESTQPIALFDFSNPVAAFSPDSRLVALVDTATNEMVVYDLEAQTITQTFANVTARVEGVTFSPDGRYLAYGSGNEVIIVDWTTGAQTAVLTGYPAGQDITWIVWSPTGSALMAASGTTDGEGIPGMMIVWQETAGGHYRELFHVESLRASYGAKTEPIALFSPGGTLVALESLLINEAWLFKILVYDLEQEKVILEIPDHQLSLWESDELLLTSQEQDERRLAQWNVRTGSSITGQASDNGGQTFAPTGDYFAQMSTTPANIVQGVEVRDWRSNQVLAQAPVGRDVGQISWSPDGRYLAASASNGTLRLWPVILSEE